MAKVRFYLKKEVKAKAKPIYVRYDIRPSERLKAFLQQEINIEHWNNITQRPVAGAKYKKLTLFLDTVEFFIKEYILDSKIKGNIVYAAELKSALKYRLGIEDSLSKKGDFIEYVEAEKMRRNESPKYSPSTIKNYNTFLKNLKEFQKFQNDTPINFNDINASWIRSFTNFLYNVQGHDTNHVSSLTKKLNTFLRAAVEDDEISDNRIYEKRKLHINEKLVPKIYLNEDEIRTLFNHNYEHDKHRNAVNLWVTDSLIGARYSDFKNIDLSNINEIDGQKIIKITQGKTEAPAMIPVDDMILDIDKKYSPHMISNTKLNKYIKEAAKVAGLTDKVEKISYPKGLMKKEITEKYKLITVHTARRSFATNMYKKGVDTRAIMYMTGHKSERQFLKYLRLSVEENAIMVGRFLDSKK